jgi:hypothetical protein
LTDAFIVKLDVNGAPVWSRQFGDAQNQSVGDIAADADGNVIMAGFFLGMVDFGGGPLTSAGTNDVFVAKLDADGGHLRSKNFGDATNQTGTGVRADASGRIVLCGTFAGSIDFGGGALTSAGSSDVFLVQLDSDLGWLWSKSFGDAKAQNAQRVDVDGSGRIGVTGGFQGVVDFGTGPLINARTPFDAFVATFDADGTPIASAAVQGSGTGSVVGRTIALGSGGRTTVAGSFNTTIPFGDSLGGSDIFLATIDATGAFVSGATYGSSGADTVGGLAIDGSGPAYIAGSFSGPSIDLGSEPLILWGGYDVYVAKVPQ